MFGKFVWKLLIISNIVDCKWKIFPRNSGIVAIQLAHFPTNSFIDGFIFAKYLRGMKCAAYFESGLLPFSFLLAYWSDCLSLGWKVLIRSAWFGHVSICLRRCKFIIQIAFFKSRSISLFGVMITLTLISSLKNCTIRSILIVKKSRFKF